MSLDKVVEEILKRGEQRKAEIIREGEKERDEQISLAEKKFEEGRHKSERRNRLLIEQLEQQEASSAELESKKNMLAAERAVMEELRGAVLAELANYSPERRKMLYSKLISSAKNELGECTVYSRKEDRPLLQLSSGVTYGGEIDGIGGLVFESKDRSVRLNYRFENLLEDVWNSRIREIHKRLFG
jgi:V/A-type H+-transporting ATPase subunit E